MKKIVGIYLLFSGILMGFYLLFKVVIPSELAAIGIPIDQRVTPVQEFAPPIVQQPYFENISEAPPQPTTAEEVNTSAPPQITVAAEVAKPKETIIDKIETLPTAEEELIKQSDEIAVVKREIKSKGKNQISEHFFVPRGLEKEVDFWKNVYSKYTTDEAVMHDPENLGKIYSVIDLPHCSDPPSKECLKRREDVIDAEKDRLYAKLWPHKDKKLCPSIRAQVGQRDKFLEGIKRAKTAIAKVEKVFGEFGIPWEISRLPFVESMFNPNARSKSGALGIWQIMPKTAKLFKMRIGGNLDDRKNPSKSTEVAAKHLTRDFNRLGAWDLAINAYNSGPGRLADAMRTLGTKDIVKIIKRYENPSYGFASRNFYPEFLAALEVYENRSQYFGGELE